MVRLVKGAYWDTEIKRAQVAGRPDYPVFTTKAATDLSYLVCAQALIDAAPHLYAQFATHNAHTLAAVRRMAADAGRDDRVPAPARHGRGALRRRRATRYGAVTAARLRPGRRARGPAALSGAPPARERRQHLLRPRPARRAGARRRRRRRPDLRRSRPTPTATPRSRRPKDIYMDRQNSLGRDYSPGRRPRAPRRRAAEGRRRDADRRPDRRRQAEGRDEPAARHQPLRHDAGCSATSPRPPTADIDAAVDAAARGPARLGPHGRRRPRRRCCAPWPTRWKPTWTG